MPLSLATYQGNFMTLLCNWPNQIIVILLLFKPQRYNRVTLMTDEAILKIINLIILPFLTPSFWSYWKLNLILNQPAIFNFPTQCRLTHFKKYLIFLRSGKCSDKYRNLEISNAATYTVTGVSKNFGFSSIKDAKRQYDVTNLIFHL